MTEIAIRDEFNDPDGQLLGYDAYDTAQRFALPNQKHIDLRNFEPGDRRIRITMIHFDRMSMLTIDGNQMSDLEASVVLFQAEQWSSGTVAVQADRNNWRGLSLSISAGTNTTESVIRI